MNIRISCIGNDLRTVWVKMVIDVEVSDHLNMGKQCWCNIFVVVSHTNKCMGRKRHRHKLLLSSEYPSRLASIRPNILKPIPQQKSIGAEIPVTKLKWATTNSIMYVDIKRVVSQDYACQTCEKVKTSQ